MRVCSTCEDMHYLWVISSVLVSHILSTGDGMQYQWVISSVPVRICSTRESYLQYPWVISSVPVRICSTSESYPQYSWGYAVPVREISFIATSPIKNVWYLDGSTIGTDNAWPKTIMVGAQTVEKEITVEEWVVNKDHAWPTQSLAKIPHCT